MKLNLKGFTLIEMLIVISLIGILATLALTSFIGTQKQARDITRKSDLKQYQTSIENYATKNNGSYPVYSSSHTITSSGGLCSALAIGICPLDPKDPTLVYKYQSDTVGTSYVLWTNLENVSSITYWIVCSNGKVDTSSSQPSSGTCPI